MDRAMADPHHPNLRFGNACPQLVARLQLIDINLVSSTLNVYGRKLAVVVGFELGANIILVNGVAAPSEFVFAVAAFGSGHGLPPFPRVIWTDLFDPTYLERPFFPFSAATSHS
jgi:hypothetical protein